MGIKLTIHTRLDYETNAAAPLMNQIEEAIDALHALPGEAMGHHDGSGRTPPSDFLFGVFVSGDLPKHGDPLRHHVEMEIDGERLTFLDADAAIEYLEERAGKHEFAAGDRVVPVAGAIRASRNTLLVGRTGTVVIARHDQSPPTYSVDFGDDVWGDYHGKALKRNTEPADLLEEGLSADHPIVATLYIPLESIRLNVHAPTLAEGLATLGQLTYDDLPDYVEHNGRTFHIAYDDNEPFEVVMEDEEGEWPDGEDDDDAIHRGRRFGTFEAIAAAAIAPPPPPPTFQPGQRVTVARIEGTSEGDVPGPFSGVVIERMDTPGANYSVLVLRHDRPRRGFGGFHAGEYGIDEADISPA